MASHYREQKAMEVAEAVYAVTSALPIAERFGMVAKLRRAAISVPSNIAEGYERRSRADYRRFITIACGSLAEVETQLELCRRLLEVEPSLLNTAIAACDETGRLLRAIERGLRSSRVGESLTDYEAESPQPSALSPQS